MQFTHFAILAVLSSVSLAASSLRRGCLNESDVTKILTQVGQDLDNAFAKIHKCDSILQIITDLRDDVNKIRQEIASHPT
ncbi:hypothetical protein BDR04DRAFT_1233446 [Suillus decipiens]|nr:hypothetical protein BDR04DRAFT_1233446 [Suillus decipiens]